MNTTTNKVYVGDPTVGKSASASTSTTASQWQTCTHEKAERGWECPRCGRINAPWVRSCDCSRDNWTITLGGLSTGSDEWWRQYVPCTSVTLDSETFKIHPESDPTYQVGGSDYYNPVTKSWENLVSNLTNAVTDGKHYHDSTYTCEKI